MWNRKYIKPPPACELKKSLTESEKGTLSIAKNILHEAIKSNLLQQHIEKLSNEHYILSRFIYTVKNQFRREKSLAGFQQINSCLKRIYEMNIQTLIKKLKDCMEFHSYRGSADGEAFLTSKQSVEYYLVRMMGTAALLGQTGNYCQCTFIQVMKHLNVGHLLPKYVVLFSATSRIWYITRSLCLKLCSWYQAVINCLPFLPATKVQWLTEDMVLPLDLSEWLTTNGYNETNKALDEQMVQQATNQEESPSEDALKSSPFTEDIGEVITRRPAESETTDKTKDTDYEKDISIPSEEEEERDDTTNNPGATNKEIKTKTKKKKKSKLKSKPTQARLPEDIEAGAKGERINVKDALSESTGQDVVKSFVKDSFRTFEDISVFQKQVQSRELEISGTKLKLSKLKAKKVISLIQMTLDSLPSGLKKSKQRKLLANTVVPEVCTLLERALAKSEKT